MNAQFAIYEALVQANIPASAARAVVAALELDMSTHLATKDDFAHLESLTRSESRRIESEFARLDQRFASLEQIFDQRFVSLEQRFDLKLENLETRLLVKLGALVTVVVTASTTVLALLH